MTTILKITNDTIEKVDDTIQEDGTATGAKGGTEMQAALIKKYVPTELLDKVQIIHSRVRGFDPDRPTILVCHDTWDDPEVARLAETIYRRHFAKFVFVSHWQMETYHQRLGIPLDDCIVIRNAVEDLAPVTDVEGASEEMRFIYHTTPHRGLSIAVEAFDRICKKYVDLNLRFDVYSSFDIYGWSNRDKPFEPLFDKCRDHPNINYHGYQPNEVVRSAVQQAHVFLYPSIWPETSCCAAIESMMGGTFIVAPEFGALPETTGGMAMMYPWNSNPNIHLSYFEQAVSNVIDGFTGDNVQMREFYNSFLHMASFRARSVFSTSRQATQWIQLIQGLSNQ